MTDRQLPQWVASIHEPVWHIPASGGEVPHAHCGCWVYGPVHALRAEMPPDDGRRICQVCAARAGLASLDYLPTRRRRAFIRALSVADPQH